MMCVFFNACVFTHIHMGVMWKIGVEIHCAELNGIFYPETAKHVSRNTSASCMGSGFSWDLFLCLKHIVLLLTSFGIL